MLDSEANCLARWSITAKHFSMSGCRLNNTIMQLYRIDPVDDQLWMTNMAPRQFQ
jgi:hypothetical protein